jgi:ketosteroid isomerase-like protein
MSDADRESLLRTIDVWDRAMVSNDVDEIGRYMAGDWTIVGPDGSIDGKARFLELVRSGVLTHEVMESHDMDVRVYGDAAVVIGRGISGGTYNGQPFYLVERVSSVFLRREGSWNCVLTHLSRLERPEGS